jgi:hypothetical protein
MKPARGKLTRTGRYMNRMMLGRFWHDGDGVSFLWNLWNPLTYPVVVICFVFVLVAYGVTGLKELPGLSLSDYWTKNKDKRIFLKRGER